MAFSGKIFFTSGAYGDDYLGSFDTATGEVKILTTATPGMPAAMNNIWGTGLSVESNKLIVVGGYDGTTGPHGDGIMKAFSVNMDLTPGDNVEYATELGEYPTFECTIAGSAPDSARGVTWLPFNISPSGRSGGAPAGNWSPVSLDGSGNLVGTAGLVDNSAFTYDTFDVAPGCNSLISQLQLRGDWLYYNGAFHAACRVNVVTGAWEYLYVSTEFPTRYQNQSAFCDLGLIVRTPYSSPPALEVYAWGDLVWHDYNANFGNLLGTPDQYDMLGLTPIRTFPITGDAEKIDDIGNLAVLGNNLYWSVFDEATLETHWLELDLDGLSVTTVGTMPPTAWDIEGNIVASGDPSEVNEFTRSVYGSTFVPIELEITGQLEATRARVYERVNASGW